MEDYDSAELLQTLDYILTGEDPNIKRLLRNLLLVAALQDKDDEITEAGPIRQELSSLHRRIDQLEGRVYGGSSNIAYPYTTTTYPADQQVGPNSITWTNSTTSGSVYNLAQSTAGTVNVSTFDLVSDSLATLNDIKVKDETN